MEEIYFQESLHEGNKNKIHRGKPSTNGGRRLSLNKMPLSPEALLMTTILYFSILVMFTHVNCQMGNKTFSDDELGIPRTTIWCESRTQGDGGPEQDRSLEMGKGVNIIKSVKYLHSLHF